MVAPTSNKPSGDDRPVVYRAPTLKEAYRRVKQVLGDDAVILGSRQVRQRQSLGLGQEQVFEVLATRAGAGTMQADWPETKRRAAPAGPGVSGDLPRELVRDVERIEELVKAIGEEFEARQERSELLADNPLAETLLEAGLQHRTLEKLMTRFMGETGKNPADRVSALTWLTDNLRASNCPWDGFYGCHAFLGKPGAGRTSLVLEAAARLQALGRRTLVLMVMPGNSTEVRRLQGAASRLGFDGAIIQNPGQLTKSEQHLGRYEAVLVDMPAFGHREMTVGGRLHEWLSRNPGFHRHLVLPLDGDPVELNSLDPVAKEWHVDWLAVTRGDLSDLGGKYLEFQDRLPLPYSLVGQKQGQELSLEIASSEALMDCILGTGWSAGTLSGQEAGA